MKAQRSVTYNMRVEGDITESVTAVLDGAIDAGRCTFMQARAELLCVCAVCAVCGEGPKFLRDGAIDAGCCTFMQACAELMCVYDVYGCVLCVPAHLWTPFTLLCLAFVIAPLFNSRYFS